MADPTTAPSSTTVNPSEPPPWHTLFPKPSTTVPHIPREEILAQLDDPELLLIDVRRTDFEGGTIRGSLNLPAQSFWYVRPRLAELVRKAGVRKVVFYCGSCNGRGPRAAGWFYDYLAEPFSNLYSGIQVLTLEGGIKGWVRAGDEYINNMDGYDEGVWKKLDG